MSVFVDTHLTIAREPLLGMAPSLCYQRFLSMSETSRGSSQTHRRTSLREDHEKNSEVKVEGRDARHEGGQQMGRIHPFRGSVEVEVNGRSGTRSVEKPYKKSRDVF